MAVYPGNMVSCFGEAVDERSQLMALVKARELKISLPISEAVVKLFTERTEEIVNNLARAKRPDEYKIKIVPFRTRLVAYTERPETTKQRLVSMSFGTAVYNALYSQDGVDEEMLADFYDCTSADIFVNKLLYTCALSTCLENTAVGVLYKNWPCYELPGAGSVILWDVDVACPRGKPVRKF